MYETQTEVAAQDNKREPERPAVDALTVRSEHRAERDTDVLVLWLSGTLNKATSALLDDEFDAQAGHATHVVFDLSRLELIDCAGLETLVRAHRRAAQNDQRMSYRQGPHAGRLPLELTQDPHPRNQPVAHRANESINENLLRARQAVRADVDHLLPLVIDPEAPWMGVSGQAAGASDAPSPCRASLAPRHGTPPQRAGMKAPQETVASTKHAMPERLAVPDAIAVPANPELLAFECSWTYAGVDVAWVRLAGELDIATTPQLQRTLREAQARARLVVLDLRKLTFIDSSGVHTIVNASACAREVGHRLLLLRGPPNVDRVFALARRSDDVEIVDLRSLLDAQRTGA